MNAYKFESVLESSKKQVRNEQISTRQSFIAIKLLHVHPTLKIIAIGKYGTHKELRTLTLKHSKPCN